MCRLEEQGCAEVAEAGGSGWLVGALPPCWSSSRCSKQALEGQTARALNLTSAEPAAEHFPYLSEGVSHHWLDRLGVDFSFIIRWH